MRSISSRTSSRYGARERLRSRSSVPRRRVSGGVQRHSGPPCRCSSSTPTGRARTSGPISVAYWSGRRWSCARCSGRSQRHAVAAVATQRVQLGSAVPELPKRGNRHHAPLSGFTHRRASSRRSLRADRSGFRSVSSRFHARVGAAERGTHREPSAFRTCRASLRSQRECIRDLPLSPSRSSARWA